MALCEIRIEIPPGAVEATETLLLEREVSGWSLLEDAVDRRAWIVGIFADEAQATGRWAELAGDLPVGAVSAPSVRSLADADWKESYKAHFKAWRFGRLHWVPVWEREAFKLPPGDEVLWLDPGMAFGTGNHETTRLVVERMVAFAQRFGRGGAVIDAGCGSGILALSAVKLGFGPVRGFDNDPEAVRVSHENAALNGLTGAVEFHEGDLVTGLEGREAALLLANIQADVLVRFAVELCHSVKPGGQLVLSGILGRELSSVAETFSGVAQGWAVESALMGEWAVLVLTRPV